MPTGIATSAFPRWQRCGPGYMQHPHQRQQQQQQQLGPFCCQRLSCPNRTVRSVPKAAAASSAAPTTAATTAVMTAAAPPRAGGEGAEAGAVVKAAAAAAMQGAGPAAGAETATAAGTVEAGQQADVPFAIELGDQRIRPCQQHWNPLQRQQQRRLPLTRWGLHHHHHRLRRHHHHQGLAQRRDRTRGRRVVFSSRRRALKGNASTATLMLACHRKSELYLAWSSSARVAVGGWVRTRVPRVFTAAGLPRLFFGGNLLF